MKKPLLPKYYRQRFMLALLEMAGDTLSNTDLQKLLFIACKEAGFDYYHFVPYKFGCYSFQAQSDLELLASRGWLCNTNNVQLRYSAGHCLPDDKLHKLSDCLSQHRTLRGNKLIAYVYQHYPYYATRSHIVNQVLGQAALNRVEQAKYAPINNHKVLYTIGYEGIAFEAYVNRLIKNGVRLLCDVRKNPLSRKYGFSKNNLSVLLPKLGISYKHIPELGIPSPLRSSLTSKADYARLFAQYCQQLPQKTDSLQHIEALLEEHKRVALTCFEKIHTSCHRHCISECLQEKGMTVCHL